MEDTIYPKFYHFYPFLFNSDFLPIMLTIKNRPKFTGYFWILPVIPMSCCPGLESLYLSPSFSSWLLSKDSSFQPWLIGKEFWYVKILLIASAVLCLNHSFPIPFICNSCFVKCFLLELMLITSLWLNIVIISCSSMLNTFTSLFMHDDGYFF